MTKEIVNNKETSIVGYRIETSQGHDNALKITPEQQKVLWDFLKDNKNASHVKIGNVILHRSEIRRVTPFHKFSYKTVDQLLKEN